MQRGHYEPHLRFVQQLLAIDRVLAPWMRDGCAADARRADARAVGASVSDVMHLVEETLDDGRLAGEVQVVETGASTVVRHTGELVASVQQHRPAPPGSSRDKRRAW